MQKIADTHTRLEKSSLHSKQEHFPPKIKRYDIKSDKPSPVC